MIFIHIIKIKSSFNHFSQSSDGRSNGGGSSSGDSVSTVSYTHLDVYKRQVLCEILGYMGC